ncbi:hypothetical protein FACS189444_5680 [Spirochaetia bacterium]|nr:hypothetical protein FACS189444_5680 [Spirochaetia bacterium]
MYATQWSRLDNAAKIFPPSTSREDTKVFRFSCELYEAVDREILQHALNAGLEQFPFYRSIIRKGLFWYYFEKSDIPSLVREEYKFPCAPLYDTNRKNLLFEVTFYKKRINLEIYHALSDGFGALQFLKTIVRYYLLEKYQGQIDANIPDDASDEQRSRDAFDTYYSKMKKVKAPRLPNAYLIRGERFPEARLGIIEGHISASALLAKTHEYKATISEFLTSLFICSIHEGMAIRDEVRPVSITIPVDLRKFFATPSVRNFFGTINVSHTFSRQGKTFEDVLAQVRLSFKEQLTPERIHARLNKFTALEHALPIQVVPLAVKAPVMKNAAWKARREESAAFSNLGKILMPAELVPYIRLFDVFTSSRRPQICLCSFEDMLVISFSSPLISTDIQRYFFRTLGDLGLGVEIVSNTANLGGPDARMS